MKKPLFIFLLSVITVCGFAQKTDNTPQKVTAIIKALQHKYIIDNDDLLKDTVYIHLLDSSLALQKFFYIYKKLQATTKFIPCDEMNGAQRHCLFIYEKDKRFERVEFLHNGAGVAKGSLQLIFEDGAYTVENLSYSEMIK